MADSGYCWVSHLAKTTGNGGWFAAGGETEQILAQAQPNLQRAVVNDDCRMPNVELMNSVHFICQAE
jgi:hypothetical protein